MIDSITVYVGVGAAGVISGPLLGYIVANRKLSGKINTSEAAQLWEESSRIRDDYRERIAKGDERTVALEARVAKLEQRNTELANENLILRTQIIEYETTVHELRVRIDILDKENKLLRTKIRSLEKDVRDNLS